MMGLSLILIVAAIAFALGWRPEVNQTRPAQTGQTPLEILNARYARGELTHEEYELMSWDLEG